MLSTSFRQGALSKLLYKRALSSAQYPQHVDTVENNADTEFDFTVENYERVKTILAKYPTNYKQSATMPLLDLAQRQHDGWLPLSAMNKVAEIVGVNPMRVYETASFYSMYYREKPGKYIVQVCGTTPCMACGAGKIIEACEEELGITVGHKTKDGKFTLMEVECLGACANAPMIQVNDDMYECLTEETTKLVLQSFKKDDPLPMGKWGSLPMNGQVSCEGPLGKTSLINEPKHIKQLMRSDEELEPIVDPKTIKEEMYY